MSKDITVTLTPKERALIHEAFVIASHNYVYTPAEREAINNVLHRIPKPQPGDQP
jgi:hypothetical protein